MSVRPQVALLLAAIATLGGSGCLEALTGRTDRDGDGFTTAEGDCDDRNSAMSPGTDEDYHNEIDDDCDVETRDMDQDGDGSLYPTDCDDEEEQERPGLIEICGDGYDNDCVGGDQECVSDTDDADAGTPDDDDDYDGDGHLEEDDCNDYNDNIHPEAREEPLDRIDQDCDGRDDVTAGFAKAVDANPDAITLTHANDSFLLVYYDEGSGSLRSSILEEDGSVDSSVMLEGSLSSGVQHVSTAYNPDLDRYCVVLVVNDFELRGMLLDADGAVQGTIASTADMGDDLEIDPTTESSIAALDVVPNGTNGCVIGYARTWNETNEHADYRIRELNTQPIFTASQALGSVYSAPNVDASGYSLAMGSLGESPLVLYKDRSNEVFLAVALDGDTLAPTATNADAFPAAAVSGITDLAILGDDDRVLVFNSTEAEARFLAPDLTAMSNSFEVTAVAANQYDFMLAAFGSNYVVAWSDTRHEGTSAVYFQWFDGSGILLDSPAYENQPLYASSHASELRDLIVTAEGVRACIVTNTDDVGTITVPSP